MNIFLNKQRKIRELWWVAIFFLVLAVLTLPVILLSRKYLFEFTMFYQMIIVIATSWICQRMRGGSITDFTGRLDSDFMRNLGWGLALGAALMIVPSIFMYIGGWVHWEVHSLHVYQFLTITATIVAGAITEEFLFRGFIFQRLQGSLGIWLAQLIMAAYFLLTHMGNPEMQGAVKALAMTNIFLASILFGIVVIRTKSLVMAVAIHVAANWVQGTLLGFGVSGHEQPSIFKPIMADSPTWLTGGEFGIEGSLPGLIVVVIVLIMVFRKWKSAGISEIKESNN